MAPSRAYGDAVGFPIEEFQATDNAIVAGDVVIFSSGKVDEDNSAPAYDTIVGVAVEAQGTANAAIRICLALPGVFFEGHVVNGTSNETGVFADNIGTALGIVESADGYACLDQAAGDDIAIATRYAKQIATSTDPTQPDNPLTAGVGVTNPRVVFLFRNSAWFMAETGTA